MNRKIDVATIRITTSEHPILSNGMLLIDELIRIPGITEQEHKELVELVQSIVHGHHIIWYHTEDTIREANFGASGIGSEITVFLTNNFTAIAQGVIGNAVFLGITSWFSKRNRDRKELKFTKIDYVQEAQKHMDKIKKLCNESHLEVTNIRQIRDYVKYEFKSSKYIYEVEETHIGVKLKRSEIIDEVSL